MVEACKILVEMPVGKWLEDVDWINLAHDLRVVGFCEHDNEPLSSVRDGEFINQLSLFYVLEKEFDQ